jgi:hypothetical protein
LKTHKKIPLTENRRQERISLFLLNIEFRKKGLIFKRRYVCSMESVKQKILMEYKLLACNKLKNLILWCI